MKEAQLYGTVWLTNRDIDLRVFVIKAWMQRNMLKPKVNDGKFSMSKSKVNVNTLICYWHKRGRLAKV